MQKKLLAMVIASAFSASAMAFMSPPTEKVVGFKPTYTQHTSAVSGKIELGQTLTLDLAVLGYFDKDNDLEDTANSTISWLVDGAEVATGLTYNIPTDAALVGKKITLVITPKALTGDPLTGIPYNIDNLSTAGASGGDGSGGITQDNTATPIVSGLAIQGILQVGKSLTASYTFNANGGDAADKSTYAWGKQTEDTAAAAAAGSNIATSGVVPAYALQPTDAGEIMEVSVQAKNGLNVTGNTVTADTSTLDADGRVDLAPAVDPVTVAITFTSTAKLIENGVNGVRPVAAVDVMTAVLTTQPGTESAVTNYTFEWFADGVSIVKNDGIDTFTPGAAHQGKAITVDVVAK